MTRGQLCEYDLALSWLGRGGGEAVCGRSVLGDQPGLPTQILLQDSPDRFLSKWNASYWLIVLTLRKLLKVPSIAAVHLFKYNFYVKCRQKTYPRIELAGRTTGLVKWSTVWWWRTPRPADLEALASSPSAIPTTWTRSSRAVPTSSTDGRSIRSPAIPDRCNRNRNETPTGQRWANSRRC